MTDQQLYRGNQIEKRIDELERDITQLEKVKQMDCPQLILGTERDGYRTGKNHHPKLGMEIAEYIIQMRQQEITQLEKEFESL